MSWSIPICHRPCDWDCALNYGIFHLVHSNHLVVCFEGCPAADSTVCFRERKIAMRFTLYTLWYTVNIKLHNKTWHEGCQAFYWEVHYNDTAMLVFIGVEERTTVQAPRAMNNGHNKHHHMLLMVAVFSRYKSWLSSKIAFLQPLSCCSLSSKCFAIIRMLTSIVFINPSLNAQPWYTYSRYLFCMGLKWSVHVYKNAQHFPHHVFDTNCGQCSLASPGDLRLSSILESLESSVHLKGSISFTQVMMVLHLVKKQSASSWSLESHSTAMASSSVVLWLKGNTKMLQQRKGMPNTSGHDYGLVTKMR